MQSLNLIPPTFSASVSCMDLLNMEKQIKKCESAGISFFHYDVVDGDFNQCLILGDTLLEQMSQVTDIPVEVHLAVYRPERFIQRFADAGAQYIAVQYEAMEKPLETFEKIRKYEAKPILCYRADTPPSEDFISLAKEVDWILKLTVNPGFSGQKIQMDAINHISSMSALLKEHGLKTQIQADGNVNASTLGMLTQAGATIFTGGTSGLFTKGGSIKEHLEHLKKIFNEAKYNHTDRQS